jgi:hypothetical protein
LSGLVGDQPVRLADRGQERGPFEHFAERATALAGGAAFFAACVTTIVTFLLVALLQNSQRRSGVALHEKLDAIADGLADLMEHQLDRDPEDLSEDIDDLKASVGLQHRR